MPAAIGVALERVDLFGRERITRTQHDDHVCVVRDFASETLREPEIFRERLAGRHLVGMQRQ